MKLELAAQLFAINAADPDGTPRRTVEGVAVPYGVEASVSTGQRVVFEQGSLPVDGPAPKFIRDHDLGRPIGIVAERIDTPDAMLFTAKISNTREGDEALVLAADGVLDSVSVGVEPTDYEFDGPVMRVKAARWLELSLLPYGAFQAAKVSSVAAAADPEPETPQTPTEETQVENTEKVEAASVVAAIPTSPIVHAQPRAEFALPSASEYISKFLAGGAEFAEFNARIRAAAPNVETTDTPGILPEPIVGSVYNNFRGLRPVVDAIGTKAMPGGGKTFRRPKVTTHTTIGLSNGENAALDQGTFVVSDNPVDKAVYGGYLRVSEEDQEWTDPAVLGLILDDMARIYADTTDNVAADALLSGTSATAVWATFSDPVGAVSFMYDAAQEILTDSNGNLPTHLFLSPNVWRGLGEMVDGADRPLFPQVGPMNAFGTLQPGSVNATAFGLTVVVDRNFAADTAIVGDPSGFEIFEQPKGAISVEAADGSLSRYIKFRGYFATLMIDADKFVKRVAA